MEVFEAIKTRRSVGKVKGDPVPREHIEKILEAATYAPNHFRTEPWRFFVISGEARERLGDLFARIKKQGTSADQAMKANEGVESDPKIERQRKNPLRAPVIIAVGVEPSQNERVILKEEYAAVNACIQNMLLAVHALGLGAIWRTGEICYESEVREFFGLSDKGEIVGFIYLGYPDIQPKKVVKTSFEDFTTWMDKFL